MCDSQVIQLTPPPLPFEYFKGFPNAQAACDTHSLLMRVLLS